MLLLLFSRGIYAENQNITFWSKLPNEELAEKIVNLMTDSELLSQTFMFGWAGAEPPQLLYDWVNRG